MDPRSQISSLVNLISKSFHPLPVNEFLDIHVWREVIIYSIQNSECFENCKDLRSKDTGFFFFYWTLNLIHKYLDLDFTFYLHFDKNNGKIICIN